MTSQPEFDFSASLVYAGTSGWSGTDTSRDRALAEDAVGTTGRRQRQILRFLADRRERGASWRECLDDLRRNDEQVHHGGVSGALSNLHRDGRVALLSETRPGSRSKTYVLPEYVAGRETIEPRSNRSAPQTVVYVCSDCGRIRDERNER